LVKAFFLLPGISEEECSSVFIAENAIDAETLLYTYRKNASGEKKGRRTALRIGDGMQR